MELNCETLAILQNNEIKVKYDYKGRCFAEPIHTIVAESKEQVINLLAENAIDKVNECLERLNQMLEKIKQMDSNSDEYKKGKDIRYDLSITKDVIFDMAEIAKATTDDYGYDEIVIY